MYNGEARSISPSETHYKTAKEPVVLSLVLERALGPKVAKLQHLMKDHFVKVRAIDNFSCLGLIFPRVELSEGEHEKTLFKIQNDLTSKLGQLISDQNQAEKNPFKKAKFSRAVTAWIILNSEEEIEKLSKEDRVHTRLFERKLVRRAMNDTQTHAKVGIYESWVIDNLDSYILDEEGATQEDFQRNLQTFVMDPPIYVPIVKEG